MYFHIQMPEIGWKDTAKNKRLEMLFLCPYISERKYHTATQPKTIGINNLSWEHKKVCLKNLWLEKNVPNSIVFFPLMGLLYKLCVRQTCDREIQ